MTGCGRLTSIVVAMFALAPPLHAQVPEPLDRINLALGVFHPTVDTRLSANGSDLAGSDVDFQSDLGLDKHRTLPNIRLEFLAFDSQGFSIGGYEYSRHSSTTLARDIRFGGIDYSVDAAVQGELRLRVVHAAWHWWFAPDPQDAVGVGIGGAWYDLVGSIDGSVSVNGGSAASRASAEGSAVAPMLTLGWRHSFSSQLRCYADVSGVRKPSGSLTGTLLNGTVGLEYYPWDNLGVALEYSANNLDLKADKESWEGRARIHFYGPAAFLRLRF
jgi:hypothetical protein